MNKKVVLVIMDGWGIGKEDKFNAILNAKTPNVDRLTRDYPNSQLKSDGISVGLPEGSPGTSEVNHLTIGGGRIIWQDLPRINVAIADHSFFQNEVLNRMVDHAKENKGNIHLTGIVSNGGVHSHSSHLFALLELIKQKNFKGKVFIHAFTDGRDAPPKDAMEDLEKLQKEIDKLGIGEIATMQGRFWLDRDREWSRTEKAFQLIANAEGIEVKTWQDAVEYGYRNHETCEYFDHYVINDKAKVKKNDSIFFFHYRSDRMFQLTKRILDEKFENSFFGSFIECSSDFKVELAFPRQDVSGTLAEVLSKKDKRQLHITETEKFPHLTYFLNGERESELPKEDWKLMESNRFVKPEYNFEPSMRAFEIAKTVVTAIEEDKYDFIVINFANTDMVGHTGHYNAAVIAAEAVDYCVGKLFDAVKDKLDTYAMLITADHGNAEEMWDYENDQPHTRHTLNRVPLIVVTDEKIELRPGQGLDGMAPTILEMMGIETSEQMTGKSYLAN